MKLHSPAKRHGGKHYLAKQILSLLPEHDCYLEAFFGGGSVLLAKPQEGVSEYANDLDGELANFWQVLRDEELFQYFQHAVNFLPLSELTFRDLSIHAHSQQVASAVVFFVKNRMSRQSLGRDYCTPTTRLRRGINEQVSAYLNAVDGLADVHARLRTVEIWCRPAVEAIAKLDRPSLTVYCDPPYMPETRVTKSEYGKFEMTAADHCELLETLANMKGKFLLSGYLNPLYESFELIHGWRRIEISMPNHASGAKTKEIKTECLWMNYETPSKN